MTNKPIITKAPFVNTISIQQYERYLPNAFDDSLSILQKINKIIKQLNHIGEISNNLVEQWNNLMEWIIGDGLTDIVSEEFNKRIADGTFDELIYRIVGDLTQLNTEDKTTLVNALNEIYAVANENNRSIGDIEELTTINKENLVQAINEIKASNDLNNQVVIEIGEATGFGVVSGLKVRQQNVLSMAVDIGNSTTPNIVHLPNGDRHVLNSISLAVTPSHPTLNRIDMVYVNTDGVISYKEGNLATTPKPPTNETNSVPLAYITVLANDTTVNDTDISDERPLKMLSVLKTDNKDNFVESINELFDFIQRVATDYATNQQLNEFNETLENLIETTGIQLSEMIGNLPDLDTTEKGNLVYAINEVLQQTSSDLTELENVFETRIGSLQNLETSIKDNLVNAINEVIATTNQQFESVGQSLENIEENIDLFESLISDIQNTLNGLPEQLQNLELELQLTIGELNNLSTVNKTDVVTAINEVNAKVQEVVTLKPTGGDDFDLIQNAINSITKGSIVFEKGATFRVFGKQPTLNQQSRLSDGIKLKSDITLVGNGATIIAEQNANYIFDTKLRTPITNVENNVKNIVIKDLTFTKPNATWFEQSHLLNLESVSNLLIENCKFIGWSGDAICIGGITNSAMDLWLQSLVENVTIRDCVFDGINKNTRQAISFLTAKNIMIENNVFKNTTRSDMPGAIDFEPEYNWATLEDIYIKNNIFDNIGGSVGAITVTCGSEIIVKNIYITENIIKNVPSGSAIYVDDVNPNNVIKVNNVNILNNSIENSGRFLAMHGLSVVTIKNNLIRGIGGSSLWGNRSPNSYIEFSDNVVMDSKDLANYTAFINFYNNSYVTIARNEFINGGYTIITFLTGGYTNTQIKVLDNQIIKSPDTVNFLLGSATKLIIHNNITDGKLEIPADTNLDKPKWVGVDQLPDQLGLGTFEALILENSTGLPEGHNSGILIAKKLTNDPYYRSTVIEIFYPWSGTNINTFFMRKGLNPTTNAWTAWVKYEGVVV